MEEKSSSTRTVLKGEEWFKDLYQEGLKANNLNRKDNYFGRESFTTTVRQAVSIELPESVDVVEIPIDTKISFYQPYPRTHIGVAVLTIFLEEEQITIHGSGKIARRSIRPAVRRRDE